jgi:protein-S-isoprenylcysteine O-methyltransferase Ste14
MNTTRYGVALVALVAYPPVLLFWLLVHPLVRYWRRIGAGWAYTITLTMVAGISAVIYASRSTLLSMEYGTHWPLVGASAGLMAIGTTIEASCRRWLTPRILIGVPELSTDRRSDRLLQEGIYAKIRHPRYAGAAFGIVAVALFANYFVVYILAILFFPAIYLVSVLEERELADRFGDAYRAYQRRVPRFVPRRQRPTH